MHLTPPYISAFIRLSLFTGLAFGAKGADSISSLGQRPRHRRSPKNSAESASQSPSKANESRFQRFVAGMIESLGRLPQAYLRKAPLALIGYLKEQGWLRICGSRSCAVSEPLTSVLSPRCKERGGQKRADVFMIRVNSCRLVVKPVWSEWEPR